jgi:hypothetical protein
VQIVNNLLAAPASGNELNVRDVSGQYVAAQLNATVAGNRFTPGWTEVAWQLTKTKLALYASAAAYARALGAVNVNSEGSGPISAQSTATARPLLAAFAALLRRVAGLRHVGAF